jgi:hypothetical protein
MHTFFTASLPEILLLLTTSRYVLRDSEYAQQYKIITITFTVVFQHIWRENIVLP